VTRHAGLFLFLPLLSQLRFDGIVSSAGYPGTQMVPAANAFLSLLTLKLLTLKLLDKERLSHIDDFNCDEALGLFAGLNILPKKSFATDYSYRTTREQQVALLKGWVGGLSPLLFPDGHSFSLDFHAIGHRGEGTALENHYQPMRGQAGPSVLTCFAMEQTSRTFCDADANLIRDQQHHSVLQFVDFWNELTGDTPPVAVLRFEVHDVRGAVGDHAAGRHLVRHDPAPRERHSKAARGAAVVLLEVGGDRHSEASPSARAVRG